MKISKRYCRFLCLQKRNRFSIQAFMLDEPDEPEKSESREILRPEIVGLTAELQNAPDINAYLAENFERVDIDDMTLEEIVRSPIHQIHKKEIQKQREKDIKEAEIKRKEIIKKITSPEFKNSGYQYAYYKKVEAEIQERLHKISQLDNVDSNFVTILRECLRVDPDDVFDPDHYPVYPGSSKGKYPEDDPEAYNEWCNANKQPFLKRFWELYQSRISEAPENQGLLDGSETDDKVEDEADYSNKYGMHTLLGTDMNNADLLIKNEEEEEHESSSFLYDPPTDLPDFFQSQIPKLPEDLSIERQAQGLQITDWGLMRDAALFGQLFEAIQNNKVQSDDYLDIHGDPFAKGYYPTLFSYFELLPKDLREHPTLKTAVLAIEKWGFDKTLEQKQELLNLYCSMLQPDPECNLKRLDRPGRRIIEDTQTLSLCQGLHQFG